MKTDNMELRLWQYAIDDGFIPSFLEGMSIAHDEPAHDEQWFRWKFEQSPYGKAILACLLATTRLENVQRAAEFLARHS